jgi:predicted metal-dependent hydrolase
MSPTWLRSRVRLYAAQVGLGYVPRVVFSEKEWQRIVPKAQWKAVGSETVGCAYEGVVYINKSAVCCSKSGDDTAAHEVLHLAQPSWRHGKRFTAGVGAIRLGRTPE